MVYKHICMKNTHTHKISLKNISKKGIPKNKQIDFQVFVKQQQVEKLEGIPSPNLGKEVIYWRGYMLYSEVIITQHAR